MPPERQAPFGAVIRRLSSLAKKFDVSPKAEDQDDPENSAESRSRKVSSKLMISIIFTYRFTDKSHPQ